MLASVLHLYKNAFTGLNPSVWLLSLVQLINRSGTMVVPFMTMYMTQSQGVSITQAGFVLTCFGVGSILGALAGGKLTDKFGYYPVMLGTLTFGGFSFFVLGLLHDYTWICVMTFVLAMINEAFRPAGMTAIGAFSNAETRTRSSSLVRLSVNLGWAIGASIGGLIASYNYQYLFWVDGWTNLFAAFIVLFFLKNRPIVKELPKTQTTLFVSAYNDKAYMIFIFLSLLFAICFFQVFTTLPLYLKRELLLSERQIGLTMALNGLLIALFEMVIITKISKKTNELNYIILGTLIVGFSYILFNLFPINPFLIAVIASIIITIGEILSMPFMMSFWLNRSNESNRGQYAALYTVSYSAAHILGPSFGGLIADHYGFHILWWVIFIMSIFTALGYYYLKQNESRIDLKSLV